MLKFLFKLFKIVLVFFIDHQDLLILSNYKVKTILDKIEFENRT